MAAESKVKDETAGGMGSVMQPVHNPVTGVVHRKPFLQFSNDSPFPMKVLKKPARQGFQKHFETFRKKSKGRIQNPFEFQTGTLIINDIINVTYL